ncbi:MAG: tRNA pseudouridine(38-40) synthase TruA [Balneolales bacterium]|nr:tRNA pseudouridine(38-40) synthase TruA [Balneolales bacterium]
MPRYAFVLQYDGSMFSGWQKQPGHSTIQADIEQAFSIISGSEISVVGSGRTDAGVHAHAMVFHADLHFDILNPQKFLKSINALTSRDILFQEIYHVDSNFHARFDAGSRRYEYHFTTRPDVFNSKYKWVLRAELTHLDSMREAGKLMEGTHDFASFCKNNPDVNNTKCNVFESKLTAHDEYNYIYTVEANRFLHSMVRCLVGSIVQVGQGKLYLGDLLQRLNQPNILNPKYLAPAHALFLNRVNYDTATWKLLS